MQHLDFKESMRVWACRSVNFTYWEQDSKQYIATIEMGYGTDARSLDSSIPYFVSLWLSLIYKINIIGEKLYISYISYPFATHTI